MKSLAGLDEIAAKEPALAQAWLYARLIAFLIAEQIAGRAPESPPSGLGKARIKQKLRAKSFALAHDQNGPCRDPRDHSRPSVVRHPRRPEAVPSVSM
jgi:hypothetical protein